MFKLAPEDRSACLLAESKPATFVQDHDGSHIKGLIMNFLHTFYPSLLRIPGFLVEFITPIIKASVMIRHNTHMEATCLCCFHNECAAYFTIVVCSSSTDDLMRLLIVSCWMLV